MKKTTLALPVGGLAALLGGVVASRRTIERWRTNPDPLEGRPVRFPEAIQRDVQLADGAEIATYEVGTGPTIVLVHGLTTSRHDWGPIAESLIEDGYRIVAIDQRGHGNSTPGTAGYGSRQLGRDLADVFEALDLHARVLVGHSMGAMAAMGFAVVVPEEFARRVDSFVSIASAGATNVVRQSLGLRIGGITIPERLNNVYVQRLRLIAGVGTFGKNPSLHMIDEVLAAFRRCREDVRAGATAALAKHDLLEELELVTVPSLVIGAGRDQLIRPKQVEELGEVLPNSTLHMYPDAGHMVIWERHVDLAVRIDRVAQQGQVMNSEIGLDA